MQTKLLLIYLIFPGLFISSCNHKKQTTAESAKEYVVILSLDGFRWDYPDSTATPNLDKIARKGVKAEYLKPSFPTKTFPNHYSMATGLYPDHHGIVMNSFYDPTMDAYYSMGDSASRNNPAFYGGEPIWETAEKQGKIAGTFFWVGSDVAGADNKATYWKPYQQSIPFSARIDTVIQWLKKPADKRPDLVMWYYHEPDAIGHNAGPFAVETDSVIKMLDSLVGVFMTKIEALPYSDKINVLLSSDHGMNPISRERVVDLSAVAPAHWFEEIQGSNPAFAFKVKKSYIDSAYQAFQNTAHATVWKSENMPGSLHYGTNERTLDLTVVADSAWSIIYDRPLGYFGGAHGYDNRISDMFAIFYAYGPAFKENFPAPAFENVDLYSLIAEILNIKPTKTDGKLKRVKPMLKE